MPYITITDTPETLADSAVARCKISADYWNLYAVFSYDTFLNNNLT